MPERVSRFRNKNPMSDDMGFLFVLYIFRNIFQPTLQHRAELIQGLGLDILIGFQPPDGLAVDAALFSELVCGHISLPHDFPQLIKSDHCLHPQFLTSFIMGVIILFIKGI